MKLADGESLLLKTYKRAAVVAQGVERGSEILTVTNRDYFFMSKDQLALAQLNERQAGVSVSYTHLDVYKRQSGGRVLWLADRKLDLFIGRVWRDAGEQGAQLFKGVRLELGEVWIHVGSRMSVKMGIIPENGFAAL